MGTGGYGGEGRWEGGEGGSVGAAGQVCNVQVLGEAFLGVLGHVDALVAQLPGPRRTQALLGSRAPALGQERYLFGYIPLNPLKPLNLLNPLNFPLREPNHKMSGTKPALKTPAAAAASASTPKRAKPTPPNSSGSFGSTPQAAASAFQQGDWVRVKPFNHSERVVLCAVHPLVVLRDHDDVSWESNLEKFQGERVDVDSEEERKALFRMLLFVGMQAGNQLKPQERKAMTNEILQKICKHYTDDALMMFQEKCTAFSERIAEKGAKLNTVVKKMFGNMLEKYLGKEPVLDENDDDDSADSPPELAPEFVPELAPDDLADAPPEEILDVNRFPNFDGAPDPVVKVFKLLEAKGLLGRCRFDVIAVLTRQHEHLTANEGGLMFGGGRTQVGKTYLKIALAMLAHFMGLATVIVTPTSKNVTELTSKIKKVMALDSRLPHCFEVSAKGLDENGAALKGGSKLRDALIAAGKKKQIVVANFLYSTLQKVWDQVGEKCEYILLLDEADEMFKNGQNRQEKELEQLRLGASSTCFVTATLLPVLLHAHKFGNVFQDRDLVILEAVGDYHAVDEFARLRSPLALEQDPLVLEQGELNWKNNYTSDKVLRLYDDAMLTAAPKRALIVDISDPRVLADGGVYEKGKALAAHYAEHEMKVIVVTGSSIRYLALPPGEEEYGKFQDFPKGTTLDAAIRALEWQGPIVVIGYTMLFRGVSVRSTGRVPTHIVAALTGGLCLEKVVQAMGRGTGDFKAQLRHNEFEDVKVLCTDEDFRSVTEYSAIVGTFQSKLGEGMDATQALRAAMKDRFREGSRSVGYNKLDWLPYILDFAPASMLIRETNFEALRKKELLALAKRYSFPVDKNVSEQELRELLAAEKTRRDLANVEL